MSTTETHSLPNGLRIIYIHHAGTEVTHCGLMIKAGTRDEMHGKEGLAHFIEHGLFKGTKKRKALYILNRLEVVGGELNAYTTKEETCVHASVMNKHLERAVELIGDIIFNSVFPENEIKKEREVIIDEIRTYQDTPYEQIFDDFENLVFKGHSLGHPILGTETSVRNLMRRDILSYIKQSYHPSQMIFSISGSCGLQEAVKLAEKYFNGKNSKTKSIQRKKFNNYKPCQKIDERSVNQVHHISGLPGFSFHDPDRFVLVLLNNLLGGPGMNSRLNLKIREKYGFTYTIESGYHAYSDTGIFHIYFATDKKNYEKTKKLIHTELEILCDKEISKRQFSEYIEQLTGQISMAQENRLSVMLAVSKGMLYFERIIRLEEIMRKIKIIRPEDVKRVALRLFPEKHGSELVYIPK